MAAGLRATAKAAEHPPEPKVGAPVLDPTGGHPANQAAQFVRNRWSARPALPTPENPPAHSMPANDGRGSNVDYCGAPIEHPREQGDADASGVIHASRFDTALDVTRELLAKNQVLSTDRAGRTQERNDQPQDV